MLPSLIRMIVRGLRQFEFPDICFLKKLLKEGNIIINKNSIGLYTYIYQNEMREF